MRFSIVTPVLNRRQLLKEAIESVVSQGYADVEHIVVDGGSSDGTIEMVRNYPKVTLMDDRRKGLYDAINIGIRHASGDVVGLLNSDDLYVPGTLREVEEAFDHAPQSDAVCGWAELFEAGDTVELYCNPADMSLDAHAAIVGASILNARFFRRSVFARSGLFSLEYPLVADREFLVRTLADNILTTPLNTLVYRYRRHPGSLSYSGAVKREVALRGDLMKLARTLSQPSMYGLDVRRKARGLYGRCLARQVSVDLGDGNFSRAYVSLTENGGQNVRRALWACGEGMLDRFLTGRMGASRDRQRFPGFAG